jgi:hypothetical protein
MRMGRGRMEVPILLRRLELEMLDREEEEAK